MIHMFHDIDFFVSIGASEDFFIVPFEHSLHMVYLPGTMLVLRGRGDGEEVIEKTRFDAGGLCGGFDALGIYYRARTSFGPNW